LTLLADQRSYSKGLLSIYGKTLINEWVAVPFLARTQKSDSSVTGRETVPSMLKEWSDAQPHLPMSKRAKVALYRLFEVVPVLIGHALLKVL
jgi:hypothetical protein